MGITIPFPAITAFCSKWRVIEYALFGSVLRDDFRPNSDVDVLVTFDPEVRWTLFDFIEMRQELEKIFGRKVDLVSRRGLEASRNSYRKEAILSTLKVIYAA